jgi:hypothetical protein
MAGHEMPRSVSQSRSARRSNMGRRKSWTIEQLAAAVAASYSVAGVLERLGLAIAGGNYKAIQAHVVALGFDTSHWKGKGHRLGCVVPPVPAAPLAQVMVRDRYYQPGKLKRRLIAEGLLRYKCSWCGRKTWRGRAILLELDHIDGDHLNNELSNLRLLCPNCHAQTPTYKGRNARYPNIPHRRDIESGIARCGSVLAYALELRVTPERVRSWLRSDRLRKRDGYTVNPPPCPGGEIGKTHGT